MDLSRYEIINGDQFSLPLTTGWELRLDNMDADGRVDTYSVISRNGVATYTPTETGVFYLAARPDASTAWDRLGELHVVALIDEDAERLRKELTDLNTQVGELEELIQYQITDPSGTAVTRMRLSEVRTARSKAEIRLADYMRVRQGRYPLRLS